MIPWRIAIFVLLGLVLVGGFAWFERTRPGSRTIALVAALAALAVAGRLAFAAIPNVQATTDVVLIAGFAVGAAPGFAVGALGALISNLWLGQGPWTPWEMAGWGLVALAGAGLAALTGRRLGRVGIAVACGLAGLAYGALLDYSVMATSGGAQSLDRYLAIAARGVPFNLAHAAGNFVLALAAGPALVRIIRRYRERSEFTWRAEWAAPAVAAVLVAGSLGTGAAHAGSTGASPAWWLAGTRNHDGGFGTAPGSGSNVEMTGWSMLGLEAAGRNPRDVGPHKRTPPDYLRKRAGRLSSTGDLERTILALHGAGINARDFEGRDLVTKLRKRRRHDGSWSGQVNLTAFGILALRAVGKPPSAVRNSRRWLQRAKNHNDGWGFQQGAGSDADSTGAALQALAAASAGKRVLRKGAHYLNRIQRHDGGWPVGGAGSSNSQSTAWAIQGLIAAGRNPANARAGGRSGFDYLAARRTRNGHYRYSKSSDQTPVWVTAQVLMAVERKALPLAAVPREQPAQTGGGNSGGTSPPPPTSTTSGSGGTAAPFTGAVPSISSAAASGRSSASSGGAPSKGKKGAKAKSAPAGTPPAPAKAKATPDKGQRGATPPATKTRPSAETSSSTDGDSGDGGTPIWVYVAAGAAALALLGAGGVWWYRRGGWVPPVPRLR